MKPQLIPSLLLAMLWLMGCNQSTKTADKNDEAPQAEIVEVEEKTVSFTYDPALDFMLTGGEAIEVLGDTLGIKMYIGTMHPGDSVALHTHPNHTVYVLQGGTLAVYFNGTDKQIMELPEGAGFIAPPLSDAAVNVGNTTIKLLTHDIYR